MNVELEDREAFTVRLPTKLHEQIKMRARVNRRNKNSEIIHLLEQAIDQSVSSDRKLLDAVTTRQDPQ